MKSQLIGVESSTGRYTALKFVCPGCAEMRQGGSGLHVLPVNSPGHSPQWDWNQDLDAPTVSPSILTRYPPDGACHSFLRDGVFEFLSDCTHSMAGTNVPMPDLEEWMVKP